MNTHIHLMEALTTFLALTDEPMARERLIELIFVNSNSVVRKNIGACTDKYLENWEPLRGSDYDRVSYGHDVENIWLLVEACKAAGISGSFLLDLYRTLLTMRFSMVLTEETVDSMTPALSMRPRTGAKRYGGFRPKG